MIVAACQHERYERNGKTKAGATRFRCKTCGKSWTAFTQAFDGMRIGLDLATRIVELACEGMSVSATARITKTKKQTVIDLVTLLGQRCEAFSQKQIRGVHVDDIQLDEIWQFIFCKRATAQREKYVGGCGDSYCFTAIERNTKLMVSWHFGKRTEAETKAFLWKLSFATTGSFHLSSDGWSPYPMAIFEALGDRVNYGMLTKIFREPEKQDRRKYSPSKIIGAKKQAMIGIPQQDRICTSHVERMNGSIRNFCKRMGRLTYCFSKRWGNHQAALGLFFAHYNWCRKHGSLKGLTPAEAHGLTNHTWSARELIETVMEIAHT